MSDTIKRYDLNHYGDDAWMSDREPDGEYVRYDDHATALAEAAATIARLEAALGPFAQEHAWGPDDRFEIVIAGQYGSLTGADLDRARAALARPHDAATGGEATSPSIP